MDIPHSMDHHLKTLLNLSLSEILHYDNLLRSVLNNSKENGSELTTEGDDMQYHYVLYYIIVPLLFGLVTLTGVFGNSLVIYVICCNQNMRTLANLLLLNLAFADLSFVLICPPFTAYQFATYQWPFSGIFGDVLCKLMHYLLNVSAYVTIYTLVLIAALRYFTIVHNAATVKYRTKGRIGILIASIWIVMLILNIPILNSYGVKIMDSYGTEDCELYDSKIGQYLYASFFVFAYLLPLCIIGMFSIGILRHLHNAGTPYSGGTMRSEIRKRNASRLVIAVVVIFAISWFPIHIHLLLAYNSQVPDTYVYRTFSVFFNFLAYFNSCINPFIYNCASKEFRMSFYVAMRCKPSSADGEGSERNSPLVIMQKEEDKNCNQNYKQCTVKQELENIPLIPMPQEAQDNDAKSLSEKQ